MELEEKTRELDETRLILEEHDKGLSAKKISITYCINKKKVLKVLHDNGKEVTPSKKTDDDVVRIITAFVNNKNSISLAAKECGVVEKTASRYVKDFRLGKLSKDVMSSLELISIFPENIRIRGDGVTEEDKMRIFGHGHVSSSSISRMTNYPRMVVSNIKNNAGYLNGNGAGSPPAEIIMVIKSYEEYSGICLQAARGSGISKKRISKVWKEFDVANKVKVLGMSVKDIIAEYISELKAKGKNTSVLEKIVGDMVYNRPSTYIDREKRYSRKTPEEIVSIILSYEKSGGVSSYAERMLGIKDSTIRKYWKKLRIKEKIETEGYSLDTIVVEYKKNEGISLGEDDLISYMKEDFIRRYKLRVDNSSSKRISDNEVRRILAEKGVWQLVKGFVFSSIGKEILEHDGGFYERTIRRFAAIASMAPEYIEKDIKKILTLYNT